MSKKIQTDIDVANIALGYLGEQRISSFTENTREARAALLHYDQTLTELMEGRRWASGRKRARLTRLSAAPDFGWYYYHQLPADCIRVLDVVQLPEDVSFTATPRNIQQFEIEDDLLLTNFPATGLVYVREVTAADISPLLTKALALNLASKMAIALGEIRLGAPLADRALNAEKDAWISESRQTRSKENSSFEAQSLENFGLSRGQNASTLFPPLPGEPADPVELPGTPDVPLNLSTNGGDTQITLTWDVADAATSYLIYRGGTYIGSTVGLTYVDPGLTNGQSYSYSIKAQNIVADSDFSNTASATPLASGTEFYYLRPNGVDLFVQP